MGNNIDSQNHQCNEETYQKMIEMKDFYLSIGLEVIPLVYGTKKPKSKGYLEKSVSELWENIEPPFNIGLRLGKVCDLVNVNDKFGNRLDKKLAKLIPGDYPRYKSSEGCHRLIIVKNAPDRVKLSWKKIHFTKKELEEHNNNQSDSKKPIKIKNIQIGEIRINNCQSLIPYSEYKDEQGNTIQYEWCGEYKSQLTQIPSIEWDDIKILVNYKKDYRKKYEKPLLVTTYKKIDLEERFYKILNKCVEAAKGSKIVYVDVDDSSQSHNITYNSRSEAEAAVVTRMISCGYSFEEIYALFEDVKPGNYYNRSPYNSEHRKQHLERLHQKILTGSKIRQAIRTKYESVKCLSIADVIYCILLSLAFQDNHKSIIASYKQLCEYLGFKGSSRTKAYQSCRELKNRGFIEIIPGSRRKGDKKATKFNILIDFDQ